MDGADNVLLFGRRPDPEMKKVLVVCGVILILVGGWIITKFNDDGSGIRINNNNEILMPWQDDQDVGMIAMPF